jgi:hypothetical protein
MNGEREREREKIRRVIAFLIAKGKKVNFHFYLSLTLASLNRKKVGKIIRGNFLLFSLSFASYKSKAEQKLLIAFESKFPFSSFVPLEKEKRKKNKRRRRKK